MDLGPVALHLVQLPPILHEVALARDRAVASHRLPSAMVDGARAEHGVVLRLARALRLRRVEGVAHTDALHRDLGVALEDRWRLDAAAIEERGDDDDRVVKLAA